MKKILWILVLAPLPLLCGCSVTGKIGGWSIFSATATSVTVVNNTAEWDLEMFLNGKPVIPDKAITPGSQHSFGLRNFSDVRKDYCLLVKARDASGNVVGVVTEKFHINPYDARCHSVVLDSGDFARRK